MRRRLSGYTAAILASDVLGPVGTTSGDVTFLAINRAIEICTGILCAGVVLALTDIGHSRRKLAAELAYLSTAIMDGFADCFRIASSDVTQFQGLRRDLLRRIIALDPTIDAAIGEASDLRYRSPVLQRAVSGLVETISAWRKAAYEIALNHNPVTEREARAVYNELPRDRLSPDASGSAKTPAELRAACCSAVRSLTRFNAQTPSERLLADSAAQGMLGMARALNGLVGVVDPPDMIAVKGTARLHVPDWLPPTVSALRVLLAVGAMSLFWIASAWPNGALAITFCAIIVVLLPLQGDLAYSAVDGVSERMRARLRHRCGPRVCDPSAGDHLPDPLPRIGTGARAARISARPGEEPAFFLRVQRQLPADAFDQQHDQLRRIAVLEQR